MNVGIPFTLKKKLFPIESSLVTSSIVLNPIDFEALEI